MSTPHLGLYGVMCRLLFIIIAYMLSDTRDAPMICTHVFYKHSLGCSIDCILLHLAVEIGDIIMLGDTTHLVFFWVSLVQNYYTHSIVSCYGNMLAYFIGNRVV